MSELNKELEIKTEPMDQDSNDNSINNDIIEQILEAEAIPNLNELKAEIRAEVRTEVIAELKEELRAQIRGEFQGQLDDLKSNEGKKAFKCTAEANIEDMDTESICEVADLEVEIEGPEYIDLEHIAKISF